MPLAFALLGLLGLLAVDAHAHAPPKGLSVLTDEQGTVTVVVTNRGLIVRAPGTDKLRLLCVEAMHGTVTDTPPVAVATGGRLVVGTFDGLLASMDQGCTWERVPPFGEASITAIAAAAGDPDTLVMATFGSSVSGLHSSHDGGRTFETLHTLSDTEYVSSVVLAPTEPNRIYAAGQDFATGDVELFLMRSADGGVTWERLPLAQQATDYRFVVRAVSHQDPDSLLVNSEAFDPAGTPGRLLESHDAGDTFLEVFQDFDLSSAGYREDGGRWASTKNGLFESDAPASEFVRTWDMTGVSCANEGGGMLYVCGDFREGDRLVAGIGRRPAGGAQGVEPFLLFSSADEPVACDPATESYQVCQTPWHDWEREVLTASTSGPAAGVGVNVDAGTPSPASTMPLNPEGTSPPSAMAANPPSATADMPLAGQGAAQGPAENSRGGALPATETKGMVPATQGCGCRAVAASRGRRPVAQWAGAAMLACLAVRLRRAQVATR